MWFDIYETLDLLGGIPTYILDDDEDMIEIRYDDGMLIDVGYICENNLYYITVVKSDTAEGWHSPMVVIEVRDKRCLLQNIQDVIFKFRNER